MLKAIETVYNGYRFRSRLEARWAVFFDALGIKYEYEKEGFDLDGVQYLPDFWLPEQDCWVEIKGQEPTEEEKGKAELLAYFGDKPVYILWGEIQAPEVEYSRSEYIRYAAKMFWFKKCSASFYAPRDSNPFPFSDHVAYKNRSNEEKKVIDEWNRRIEYTIKDVPLPIARLLKPYTFLGITLNETIGKVSVEDPREEQDCISIASCLEKHEELLEFLAIRRGWKCWFNDGNHLSPGWGECSMCGQIQLNSYATGVSCECHNYGPPRPYKDCASPRLIAAYTKARQARFEHGERP
jgi:hypothetical protein